MLAPLFNRRWILLLVHVSWSVALFSALGFSDEGGRVPQAKSEEIISNGMFRIITQEEEEMTRIPPTRPMAAGSSNNLQVLELLPRDTGTPYSEWIEYQLPSGYDPSGPSHPLMVCWHRYGQTCVSVSIDSQIDEECESRNWIYLSITGYNQCNFGCPLAQDHCTAAITYLIDILGFNINTNRIYMAGCSMGGGAALSYSVRHMSKDNPYPVAGVILVSSPLDWIDAYSKGDQGVQYWMPLLLGNTPDNIPFDYKRISGLYLDNGAYVENQSMGQNARQKLPLFITYAGNDPLTYLPGQNSLFISMLSALGAEYQVDYFTSHATPHTWSQLDVDKAFDYLSQFSLLHQEREALHLLADQEVQFFWMDLKGKAVANDFSRFQGEVDEGLNSLLISDAFNMDSMEVDCAAAGLDHSHDLLIDYDTGSLLPLELRLSPIEQGPAYTVDSAGVLHPAYSYDSLTESVIITCEAQADLDLKISFYLYNLTLNSDSEANIGQNFDVDLQGGDPNDGAMLFFSLDQHETTLGIYPFLLNPLGICLWYATHLDGAGNQSLSFPLNDPSLTGITVHSQFVTYDVGIKELSNLVSTHIE